MPRPTLFSKEPGRCILLLFSLYRFMRLRLRETKSLARGHPVLELIPLIPQTRSAPSHSNLYTQTSTSNDYRSHSPSTLSPTLPLFAHHLAHSRQAGHTKQVLHGQISCPRWLPQPLLTLGLPCAHCRISSPFRTEGVLPPDLPVQGKG